MARIRIAGENAPEKIIELSRDVYTVGRSEDNDICLQDRLSSRHHGKIIRNADNNYCFVDVGSANGSFINNQRLTAQAEYPVNNDDKVIIGRTEIVFEQVAAAAFSKLMPYSDSGLLVDMEDADEYELSATLDASVSLAQLSESDSYDANSMQKALKRLEAMCVISEAIGNIMEQSKLFKTVLQTIFGLFPKAGRAFILLNDNDSFIPAAARSRTQNELDLSKLKVSQTVLRTCVRELRSLLSNNTAEDERFNEAMSINQLAISSFICSPLLVNDEVLGIMQIEGGESEEFDETDLQMLTGISGQVAIAVKNIRLASAIEKESAQRANLQRYFSPNMVDMMLSGDVNTELGGKLYQGTVFFSDIIGFTAMSESMEAEKVVASLNRYFTVMQDIIYRNQGNVDKFGGDAIMAFWSVPRHKENDELLAILTGVQMQIALWPFNLELKAENLRQIYMGIGINTGEFVAGNIGSEEKIEFTLIGDNVNLAARIEARAGKTQVMCSAETYEKIRDDVIAVELPPVMFKGKSTPQHTYSVRGAKMPETGEIATNIPLNIAGSEHSENEEFFMLSKISQLNGKPVIEIETDTDWAVGDSLAFEALLIEFHDKIIIEATVISKEDRISPDGVGYYLYTLNNIAGEKFNEIFLLGNKYITELPWEKMGRDRKVEGK